MLAVRTVYCPVDFSPATPRQIRVSSDLSRTYGARLVLHHNVNSLGAGAAVAWMWNADHHDDTPRSADTRLRTLMRDLPPDVAVESHLTQGPPTQMILAMAEAAEADVVVMTTHGESTEDHTSITETILTGGGRAVLALHDDHADQRTPTFAAEGSTRQVVLLPTDLTPDAQRAIVFALDLAARLPIDLHLLHLVDRPGRDPMARERRHDDADRALRRLIPDDLANRIRIHVDEGAPATGIVEAASRLSADCIVMGEHTRSFWRRWISEDTSHAVLHQSPCPVMYVP